MGSGALGKQRMGVPSDPEVGPERRRSKTGQDKTRRYVRAIEALCTAGALVLAGILMGAQVTGEVVGALIDAFADVTDVVGSRGRGRRWSRLGLWPFGSRRARCLLLVAVESSVRERKRRRWMWVGAGGRGRGSVVVGVGSASASGSRTSAIPSRIPGAGRVWRLAIVERGQQQIGARGVTQYVDAVLLRHGHGCLRPRVALRPDRRELQCRDAGQQSNIPGRPRCQCVSMCANGCKWLPMRVLLSGKWKLWWRPRASRRNQWGRPSGG